MKTRVSAKTKRGNILILPKKTYIVLGTDGFGRSDTRTQLRHFFEVDRGYIAYAAIKGLVDTGKMPIATMNDAMQKYGINPRKMSLSKLADTICMIKRAFQKHHTCSGR